MGFKFNLLMAEELQVELQIKYMLSGEPFTTLEATRSSTGIQLRRELDKELPPGKAVQRLVHGQHLVMDFETLGDCGIPDGEAVLFAVVESLPNTELQLRGYTPCDLKLRGYMAADMKEARYPVSALLKAHFTAEDLWEAGYTAISLRKGGYSAADVRDAGYLVEDMRKAGFSAADLKHTGCSAHELFLVGYSLEQIACLGYRAITIADLERWGCTVDDMRRYGYSAADLKQAGYAFADLTRSGYTGDNLLDAGFRFDDVLDLYIDAAWEDLRRRHACALEHGHTRLPSSDEVYNFDGLSVMSETLEARSERQQKRRRDAQQRARRHDALHKRRNRATAEERRQRQVVCRPLHTFTRNRAHARNRKKMMMLPEDHWIAAPRTAQLRKCVHRVGQQ